MEIEKTLKIMLVGVIFADLYIFIRHLLVILGAIPLYDYTKTSDILFSFFIVVTFAILNKHRYWILAAVFWGVEKIATISAATFHKIFHSIYNVYTLLSLIVAMFCVLLSAFYLYKALRVEDIFSKKYNRLNRVR